MWLPNHLSLRHLVVFFILLEWLMVSFYYYLRVDTIKDNMVIFQYKIDIFVVLISLFDPTL